MDLTVPLIFISVLVVGSFSLFLVFKFGIKKKSYEQALAEHRKQTSALLGTRPKLKEKKNKKASKKINKEKSAVNNNVEPESSKENDNVASLKESRETENTEKNVSQQGKSNPQKAKSSPKQSNIHVEFKEEAEELPVEIPVEKEVKEVINKKDEIHKIEPAKDEKKPEKSSGGKKNKQLKQESEKPAISSAGASEPQPVEKPQPKEEKVVSTVVPVSQEPIANTGKEKKKKKSEFNTKQQLTAERDQLIYTLHNAELSRSEVQLLIDLLLNKQLEAPAVIDEWSEGKYDPVQKLKKQLAEKEKLLADEQELLVGVQAKLKEIRSEQLAERAQLQQKLRAAEEGKVELIASHNRLKQKIQELEDVRNKEAAQMQRIIEDNKALQMQRDKVYQESDVMIHNLKAENANLNGEIQTLQHELQERIGSYQACALQIQPLQEELRRTKDYIIEIERNHSFALAALDNEKRVFSENAHQEEQRLHDIIEQLKLENIRLQEERNIQMNGSADENKAHEVKLLNLTNELSSVKSELSSANQRLFDAVRQHQAELDTSSEIYAIVTSELEEQKNKNNELRKKNWKVMEALNAAESRNKPSPLLNIEEISSEIRLKEENAQKQFLQRLFPSLKDLRVSAQGWQQEYESFIIQHVKELKSQPAVTVPSLDHSEEVAKLKAEVLHYKSVLDDTDGALNKLQLNIEQEERTWRNQLMEKDAEIQELKNKDIIQLQSRVASLENQLEQEQLEKQRLLEEHQVRKHGGKTIATDSTATIEKLSEELDRLKEQLRVEQSKNSDASVYQNGKTS